MSDPAVGVKDILESYSVGTFGPGAGWRIFIANEPDDNDTCITIYGTGQWQAPDPKWALDFPAIQVRIRGGVSTYEVTYAKAKEVKDRLLGIGKQTVNGDLWRGIVVRSDIGFLMNDQKERPIFTINFALYIEVTPSAESNRSALS